MGRPTRTAMAAALLVLVVMLPVCQGGKKVPGQFIALLNPDCEGMSMKKKANLQAWAEKARGKHAPKGQVKYVYESMAGFTVSGVGEAGVAGLRGHKCVLALEQDEEVVVETKQAPNDAVPAVEADDQPAIIGSATPGLRRLQTATPQPGILWALNGAPATPSSTQCQGTAWIVDSGISDKHPYLKPDLARSVNFVADASGTVNAAAWADQHSHGSHVAGIIAAVSNPTYRVAGICPGAKLVAVRVLDATNSGSYAGVAAGLNYVAANAVAGDVTNMSVGGSNSTAVNAALAALAAKNIYVTLASGNGRQLATTANSGFSWAAGRSATDTVYAVSGLAIDSRSKLSGIYYWSNYDNTACSAAPGGCAVAYAAPGNNVLSTVLYSGSIGTAYAYKSGTSMASPHLAGLLLRYGAAFFKNQLGSTSTAPVNPYVAGSSYFGKQARLKAGPLVW